MFRTKTEIEEKDQQHLENPDSGSPASALRGTGMVIVNKTIFVYLLKIRPFYNLKQNFPVEKQNQSRGEKDSGVLAFLCQYGLIWKNLRSYKIISVNRSQTHRGGTEQNYSSLLLSVTVFKRH